MQLKARIAYIRSLQAGANIGYGDLTTLAVSKQIATIPIGYADGTFLFFLQKGYVLIRGQSAPILGKVFMDHFMVDVTSIAEADTGDEVVIFGEQGEESISAQELAIRAGIGPLYSDFVTLLTKRVPRIYIDHE
jgi:alanine racemase